MRCEARKFGANHSGCSCALARAENLCCTMRQTCKTFGVPTKDFDAFIQKLNAIYRREQKSCAVSLKQNENMKKNFLIKQPYHQVLSSDRMRFFKKTLQNWQNKWSLCSGQWMDALQQVADKILLMERKFDRQSQICKLNNQLNDLAHPVMSLVLSACFISNGSLTVSKLQWVSL